MTVQCDWINGLPRQTDDTNAEWVNGLPFIIIQGVAVPIDYPITVLLALGLASTASRVGVLSTTAQSPLGLAVSASRLSDFPRPSSDIDIGPGATDRNTYISFGKTLIDLANPANATGVLTSIDLWFYSQSATGVKVGTFFGTGTSYTNRDTVALGTVTSGSKQTFSELNCAVEIGDFIGIFFTDGYIEGATSGGSSVYYNNADQFGTGQQTYAPLTDAVMSIYGTGSSSRLSWGLSPTVSRASVLSRTSSLAKGSALVVSRIGSFSRATSLTLGLSATAETIRGIGRIASVAFGLSVTSTRKIVASTTTSVARGLSLTVSRQRVTTRTSSRSLGFAATASRAIVLSRNSLVVRGTVAVASRLGNFSRSISNALGRAVSVTRMSAFNRVAAVVKGCMVTITTAKVISRTSEVVMGLAITASRSWGRTRDASVAFGWKVLSIITRRAKRKVNTVGTDRDVYNVGENRDTESF